MTLCRRRVFLCCLAGAVAAAPAAGVRAQGAYPTKPVRLVVPRPCPGPIALLKMAIYNDKMDISVTEFKHRCLEIVRRVEKTGKPVTITRRGRAVAQLTPSLRAQSGDALKPWERLRAMGGRILAEPGESVLRDEDFEALR